MVPNPSSSSRDAAAQFAHLAAVLSRLRSLLLMYDDAAEIYCNFPKQRREEIDQGTMSSTANITHGLARIEPVTRDGERKGLLQDVQALEEVMSGSTPMMRFDASDLELITDFVLALDMVQARSKRELSRLFDAVRANDIGRLMVTSIPRRGNTKQKLEMMFEAKSSD